MSSSASFAGLDRPVAVIKVVGVGGGGGNAVNRMIQNGLRGVEFIAINTDAQALLTSDADEKLSIGGEKTRGLGAGGSPEVGEEAAETSRRDIEEVLAGADMIFITVGEGGGTGTGAAPIVAELARASGALTVAVVTRPFDFEGRLRSVRAEEGIKKLRESVDTLIVVPNQRLLENSDDSTRITDAFAMADEVLMDGVRGISDIITQPGLINTDFADVKAVMSNAGSAMMGIGSATGEERAATAARKALQSPLLEDSVEQARGILLSISGAEDMTLAELNTIASIVKEVAHDDANINVGMYFDSELDNEIKVTVLAAGFDHSVASRLASTFGEEPAGEVIDLPVSSGDAADMTDVGDMLGGEAAGEGGDADDPWAVPDFLQ